jgi:hypothetical protein
VKCCICILHFARYSFETSSEYDIAIKSRSPLHVFYFVCGVIILKKHTPFYSTFKNTCMCLYICIYTHADLWELCDSKVPYLYYFFNLGANGGGWLAPRPGHFTPGKRRGAHCTGGWVGPGADLEGCGKFFLKFCVLSVFFIRIWFFILIVLHFAFCLYL